MPSPGDQARDDDAFTADFTVARALMAKGRGYQDAVDAHRTYDRSRQRNEGEW
jgi:hypothetical protein